MWVGCRWAGTGWAVDVQRARAQPSCVAWSYKHSWLFSCTPIFWDLLCRNLIGFKQLLKLSRVPWDTTSDSLVSSTHLLVLIFPEKEEFRLGTRLTHHSTCPSLILSCPQPLAYMASTCQAVTPATWTNFWSGSLHSQITTQKRSKLCLQSFCNDLYWFSYWIVSPIKLFCIFENFRLLLKLLS